MTLKINQKQLLALMLLVTMPMQLPAFDLTSTPKMSKEEQLATVKLLGKWLEVYTERCGAITKIPFSPCDQTLAGKKLDENIMVIKNFGDWLESCNVINIGVDEEDKIKKCKQALSN